MDEKQPIRVMIVDDHTVVRRGLGTMLSVFKDLVQVGEARNGEQAVALCAELNPDVILMDLMMPDMNGVEATRLIRERHPQVQIIALTSYKERDMVEGALSAGAIGYLLKDVSADELAAAIRNAHERRPTLSPEAAQVLIQAARQPVKVGAGLTAREREVLKLMVDGLTNQEIAAHLFVSDSTAKYHVSSILSKLGVSSRTEAVSLALREHLV